MAPQRFSLSAVFIACSRQKPVQSETHKQNGCRWQPWFYSGLVAHCYVGLSEEAYSCFETRCTRHAGPNDLVETHPRTQVSQSRTRQLPEKSPATEWTRGQRHSSCLWLQIFGVKRDSFLPHCKGDRGDLARQGETRHLWPHPFRYQSLVELPEWTLPRGGLDRRTLE